MFIEVFISLLWCCVVCLASDSLRSLKAANALPQVNKIRVPLNRTSVVSTAELTESSSTVGQFNFDTGSSGSFIHAFVGSLSMVIVSELGDKTFFIAATLSMKYSRTVVFAGSITALFVMTVLSAFFGYAVQVIPRIYVVYFSALLFFLFGVKMLHSAYHMTDMAAAEELEEAQAEIQKRETKTSSSRTSPADLESGMVSYRNGIRRLALLRFIGTVFFEAFILTFFAEWGDRSQITTIVLAARESVSGVISGGILGHCLCTGLAVIGGRLVSQRISVKNVTYIGGVVFVIFAISSLLLDKEVSGLVPVR